MKVPLFKNSTLQEHFNKKGYVVVPLLKEEQVLELKKIHQSLPGSEMPFESTSFIEDFEYKKELNKQVNNILKASINKIFAEHKPLGTSYLIKRTGVQSKMPIHQDWTVVDETKYASITCWIPLVDTNYQNGAIQVIDGSHKFSDALRSPSIPVSFKNIEEEIKPYLKTISMKAGEAFIFNQALMHASPPNLSNEDRVAVTYGLTQKDAQLFMLYHKDGEIEKWEMPNDMFLRFPEIRNEPLIGDLKEKFEYKTPELTLSTFKNLILNQRKQETMIPLFKNKAHQTFFNENGYLKLPLLEETEIAELSAFYESIDIDVNKEFGFHVSMDSIDAEQKRMVKDKIWSIVLPKLDNYLVDYKPYVASFVSKEVNPKGVVPAHQDWSFVDNEEDGYASLTCWTTLVDTTLENGALGVIKGSHKFMQNHRPSPSPQAPVPLSEHMFSIFPYLDVIEMKAGEVLLFDNRTFHASMPNTSNALRLAVGVGITQKDARFVHYMLKPDGQEKTLLKYAVDEDFFIKYNNARLSEMYNNKQTIEDYELIGEVPYVFEKPQKEELIETILAAGNEYNEPMCLRLSELFGYDMNGNKLEEEEVVENEPIQEEVKASQEEKKPFFEVYTPYNIYREIKYRITGK